MKFKENKLISYISNELEDKKELRMKGYTVINAINSTHGLEILSKCKSGVDLILSSKQESDNLTPIKQRYQDIPIILAQNIL